MTASGDRSDKGKAPDQATPDDAGEDVAVTRVSLTGGMPPDAATRIVPASDLADRTQVAAPTPAGQPAAAVVQAGMLINNNYRIHHLISAGGMGEVYHGENVFTGDPVAIKIVLTDLARDPDIIALFKREARILGQLNDDAIVRYHNFVLDTDLDRYCLVMEFIDGTHLWDRMAQSGPLPEADALALMRRLAVGLGKAHAQGVTHRDLSPDNVILRNGNIDDAVLIDFGIARSDELGEGGLQGRFAGKLKYIAPEQLGHWDGKVGPRTDIYGMALMMAAVLRGQPLDMGNSVVQAAQARRTIPNLAGLGPRVMPLLQYMLEPDPKRRPADMAAVVTMLDDPTHVPSQYRLPMWQADSAKQRTGQHTAPSLGRMSSLDMIEDASDSPFGDLPSTGLDQHDTYRKPAHGGRIVLMLGLAVLLGLGGWLTHATWWPAVRHEAPPRTLSGGDSVTVRDRADSVAALPARDVSTRAGWLATQDLPTCTLAQRIVAGPDAGQLAWFSPVASGSEGAALLDAYSAEFGARPALVEAVVTAEQCPALAFVDALSGRVESPPNIVLDSVTLRSGDAVRGRVSNTAGRSLWLFLVSSGGEVHDLSPRLQPASDGSFLFDVSMALAEGDAMPLPQLLVAVVSRTALVTAAVTSEGAPVAPTVTRVLDEIAQSGGAAAADIAGFTLMPAAVAPVPPDVIESHIDAAGQVATTTEQAAPD